jgi:hypothetical protein
LISKIIGDWHKTSNAGGELKHTFFFFASRPAQPPESRQSAFLKIQDIDGVLQAMF